MKSSEKYKPLSCVFYDLIEHYAVLREGLSICMDEIISINGEKLADYNANC